MKLFFTRFILFVFFCCTASFIALAHNGSVRGKVLVGKKAIERASIFINELQRSATTDAFGHFFLKEIPLGRYSILISHLGYETISDSLLIEDGITTEMYIQMHATTIKINEVTINAKRDLTLSSISGLDLASRPVNSSQDLLRLVPGMFISQHQGGGKAEQMFLRGFDVDHGTDVSLSVDGMPINMVSHAHGQGYADAHFIISESVAQLNFEKGPYAIDKGNFATAAWVDYKTKNILEQNFVKAEAGMFGYARTVLGLNLLDRTFGNNKEEAYVMAEYNYNRSYFDAAQNFNRFNILSKYSNYISDKKKVTFSLSAFNSGWDASGQIPERAVSEGLISRFGAIDGERGQTSRYNATIQYDQSIGSHSYLKSNVYLIKYDFELFSNFTFFLNDTSNGDQIKQKESRITSGYNASFNSEYHLGKMATKTEIGIGIRYDKTAGSELSHTLGMSKTLQALAYGAVQETNFSSYINQVLFLSPKLVLHAGTRVDYFIQQYNNQLPSEPIRSQNRSARPSPKLGMYYNFNNSSRVYVKYGVGFHSNDTRVLLNRTSKNILPRANSMDIGFISKINKSFLFSTALWMLDLQQEFVYVGDEAVIEPSGRTRRMGLDVSLRYDVCKWLYLDADLNLTRARYRDLAAGVNYVPLAANLTSIGGASFRITKNITTGLRFRHIGQRPANEDYSVAAKGYTVFDAVATYNKPKYSFGLQIQNLFNTEWNEAQFDTETRLRHEASPVSEICFTPGTPFFLKLTATYKF